MPNSRTLSVTCIHAKSNAWFAIRQERKGCYGIVEEAMVVIGMAENQPWLVMTVRYDLVFAYNLNSADVFAESRSALRRFLC